MNEWNIQSRARSCQACGLNFSDQQVYHTVLFDLRNDLERRDLCEACWNMEHGENSRDRKGFISHWVGTFEPPPAAPPEAIQKENAESLLRRIIELNDPRYAAVSYILAAMLERKRILKVKEQIRRDGQRLFLYEHPKTGDLFTIPDPELQLNQVELVQQLQRDVADLLEHGFPPAPGSAPVVAEMTATAGGEPAAIENQPPEAVTGTGTGTETGTPEPELAGPSAPGGAAEAEPIAH